jgi:hypothetical protein
VNRRGLNTALWIVQALLALFFVSASYFRVLVSHEVAVKSAPWVADVQPAFLRFIAAVELAGGLGVVLPAWLGAPRLVPLAALGIVLLMTCAVIFHVSRGEAHIIWMNLSLAALAAFVAWGRSRRPASAAP